MDGMTACIGVLHAFLLSERNVFSEMFDVFYYCDRKMIMYVHQQYYIISEQVFVQTYEDII